MTNPRSLKRHKDEQENKPFVEAFRNVALSHDKDAFISFIRAHNSREEQEAGFACLVDLAKQHEDDVVWLASEAMSGNLNSFADLAGRVFGMAGRVDKIDEVLKRGGVKGAVFAYAFNGMADKVEELLLQKDLPYNGMMPPMLEAEFGFDAGGHMKDSEKLLRILSLMTDDVIRKEFSTSLMVDTDEAVRNFKSEHVTEAKILIHEGPVTDHRDLVQKASEINNYMRTCRMTYEQALELHSAMKEIDRRHPNNIVSMFFGDGNARTNAIMAKVAEIKDRHALGRSRLDM